jgi:hypothetical protein
MHQIKSFRLGQYDNGSDCQQRLVRQSFRALGRDLYFDLKCTCSYRTDNLYFANLLKHTIKLSGYADDNFFDRVNAEPLEGTCKCGRKYRVQWFRDGVEAAFLPN